MDSVTLLLCQPGAELYGSDRMAVETVRALTAAQYRVGVVIPATGPLESLLEEAGAQVLVEPSPVLRKSLMTVGGILRLALGMPAAVLRARRTIRRSGAHAVYVNTIVQPAWILGARLAGVPSIVHTREAEVDGSRLVQWVMHLPLRGASIIVANSKSTAAHVARFVGRSRDRIDVVHNGKDWNKYFDHDFAGFSPRPQLLFLGRLSPRKGVDVAIAACAKLHQDGIPAELTIAGSVFAGYEWYEAQIRQQAIDLGIAESCNFVGFVESPRALLAAAEIVLVPSRVEPFGTVAAEAMAAGRPTVVSSVGGLTEIVTAGVTGLVVPIDDFDAMADACRDLIANPELARAIATAGRTGVLETFSREEYDSAITSIVDRLTQRTKAAA